MSRWIIILLFLVIQCRMADNTVEIQDAYGQIHSAVVWKAAQCQPASQPSLPLVVPFPPLKRHLDLCTLAITRATECPFVAYPLACAFIYLEKDQDIPWYLDYDDVLVKEKL